MARTPKKEDHIELAISGAKKKFLGIKDTVAKRILAILNDHTGTDLKRSEAQEAGKELIELQVEGGK